nr:immunoglobulin heavy chain junction region [Mus musculus]
CMRSFDWYFDVW